MRSDYAGALLCWCGCPEPRTLSLPPPTVDPRAKRANGGIPIKPPVSHQCSIENKKYSLFGNLEVSVDNSNYHNSPNDHSKEVYSV